jgi:uncharacterized protein YjbJ (UPF0337 family)
MPPFYAVRRAPGKRIQHIGSGCQPIPTPFSVIPRLLCRTCLVKMVSRSIVALDDWTQTNFQPDIKELMMNWDHIEGNWKQLKGKVQQQWGKLTDDQIEEIKGNRQMLAGKIQEMYGVSKEEAEEQIERFNKTCH